MDKEKNQKQENMQDQNQSETSPELTKNQLILYCIIIGGSITIFILAMIGVNIFALLIIIGVVLIYVYFDKDLHTEDNKENNNPIS